MGYSAWAYCIIFKNLKSASFSAFVLLNTTYKNLVSRLTNGELMLSFTVPIPNIFIESHNLKIFNNIKTNTNRC